MKTPAHYCSMLCGLSLVLSVAPSFIISTDARKTSGMVHIHKTIQSSDDSGTKINGLKRFDVYLPTDDISSNSGSYGVSSPFNLPPYDSLPPIPNTPPFCLNPPSTPQTPTTGSTGGNIPSPIVNSPPSPATIFSPPTSFGPPYYQPNPPIIIPSPPGYFEPSPPTTVLPSPTEPILSPPYNNEPGPPTTVLPSPTEPILSPPYNNEPSPPSYVPISPPTSSNIPSTPPSAYLPPVIYPPPAVPPPPRILPATALWCVAKPSVPDPIIQEAMNYACASGADCDQIQPNGSCFQPNTLFAHASYAFNSYWQRTKVSGGTCEFGGTAMLVTVDPSFDGCQFIFY